jgi:hypothetical protein
VNVQALQTALVGWASGVMGGGVTVYYGEPNGPRPLPPAVRLKLVGGPDLLGQDMVRSVIGDPNNFNIEGPREFMLSVTAIGDTALQMASDLQTSFYDPATQIVLDTGNLSMLSTSGLRDVSELIDTKWEQRRQFDVTMLTQELVAIQPGVIESTEAAGSGALSSTPSISATKT